jgi:hypothetical protein
MTSFQAFIAKSEYTIGKSTLKLVIDNTSIIFITPQLIILQAQQTIKLVKKEPLTISAIKRESTEHREFGPTATLPTNNSNSKPRQVRIGQWQHRGDIQSLGGGRASQQSPTRGFAMCVVLCVWCGAGCCDCAIAVSVMVLVNDSVCCGVNIAVSFL